MSDPWAIILSGSGIFTLVGGVIAAIVGWRKNGAETTQIIEATAGEQIKTLVEENRRLWEEVRLIRVALDERDVELRDVKRKLRSRDDRVDSLSAELDDSVDYIRILRDELLRQDPSLTLPEPPPRIARHFIPP